MTAEDRAATCPYGSEIATLSSRVGSLERKVDRIEHAADISHGKLDAVINDVSFIRGKLENGTRFSSKTVDRVMLTIIAILVATLAVLLGVEIPV